ncbi:putative reverse transcriptase domain-containing protein [Tanacetum coccineum]
MTAMISIRDEPSISFPHREEVKRLLALTTPPPSPLTPLSSPLPQIPFPPLPGSPAASVLPTSPPASPIQDKLDVCLPPRKRLCSTQGPRYEVGESLSAAAARPIGGHRVDYGFVDSREAVEEVAPMTLKGVNTRVTELAIVQKQDTQDIYAVIGDSRVTKLAIVQKQDTQDIYAVIGDTQDRQTHIYQRVETLVDDSQYHYETARLLDQEALVSQEAWGCSIEAANRRSQTVTSEMLQVNHRRQAKIAALQTFDRTGEYYRDSRDPLEVQHSQLNQRRLAMIDQGVTAALAARDVTRNGDDNHTSGTGVRRTERIARECTYQDFMKCQPLYFKGTEGVVELTQWFERMETVFRISNCSVDNQIKFSTCTLLADLRKKMTDKYCPRNEMKKLKVELWNLKVKGTDVTGYNQRLQELALLCVKMFPEESDKVERYVGGLPDMIQGSVVASKPKTMQEATEMASELMDKKINTIAERQAKNKRKAYTAGSGDKKQYGGSKPLCPKCNYNHNGPCAPKCYKCNKFGHLGRNCRSSASVNLGCNQRGNGIGQGPTCDSKLVKFGTLQDGFVANLKNNNNNRGNQVRNANAPAKVYAVGHAGTNPNSKS